MDEPDLSAALHEYTDLLRAWANGSIEYLEFSERYGSFYYSWALDGHEANEQEKKLLKKYEQDIELHRRAAEEVLSGICSEDDAEKASYVAAGRYGHVEARRRLKALLQTFPNRAAGG